MAAVALLGGGVFFTALDQTVVVTAIPAIARDLAIPFGELDRAAWIVTAFLIGYAVALPLAGRLADTRRKRDIYVGALALFALASLPAAVATDLWVLVGARVVQAAGGGALVPIALAYANDAYQGRERTIAFGLIVALAEAGGVMGPLWGAGITQVLSWRWIFFLNLPAAALLIAGVWRIPEFAAPRRVPLDLLGAVLAAVGLGALTAGLARDASLPGAAAAGLAAGGAVILVAFVLVERRRAQPLAQIDLFRRRPFAAGNLVSLLIGAGLIVPMVNVPLFAATVLERDALGGGLLLLRMTVLIPVGAVAGGIIAARVGNVPPVIAGASLAAAGLWLSAGWSADPGDVVLTRDLALAGFGFGLVIAPLTSAVVGSAGRAHAGVAAGLVTVFRLTGMTLALAALTPWALDRFGRAAAQIPLPVGTGRETAAELARLSAEYNAAVAETIAAMFNDLFLVAALVCVAAVVPALLLARRRDSFE